MEIRRLIKRNKVTMQPRLQEDEAAGVGVSRRVRWELPASAVVPFVPTAMRARPRVTRRGAATV